MELQLIPNSDVPIYQQIVTLIKTSIQNGTLPVGHKLPTVRELAAQINISRGTVKHAYEELEKQGMIEMTQGRGTFVQGPEEEALFGRKDRAMVAIDKLLDDLQGMSFSLHDIQIFFDLKLREREDMEENIKVGIVDCNPETLEGIQNQISSIANVDIYKFALESVKESPYRFDENLDLAVTTFNHYEEVLGCMDDQEKLVRLALSATQGTAAALAKIEADQRIGVLCTSAKFSVIIRRGCMEFCGGEHQIRVRLFDDPSDLWQFLNACDVLIVPPNYLHFCNASDAQAIQKFANSDGRVISYEYQIDQGSLFHLEERINRIIQQRHN